MAKKAKHFAAEIITIGTELTTGRIIDSNSALIAKILTSLGIQVQLHTQVPDNRRAIGQALVLASKRSNLVLTSGGLGPTDDDITTSVITDLLGKELVRDKVSLENALNFLKKRNRAITKADLKMVSIPKGAKILKNSNGMALGYYLRYNSSWLLVTPAVPRELSMMLQNEIVPLLKNHILPKNRENFASRIIRIFGLPESQVNRAVKRSQIGQIFPEIQIGYQCSIPEIQVILEIKNKQTPKTLEKILDQAEKSLRAVLGDRIFGINDETLSEVVHQKLIKSKKTLAIAESCTGGLLSASLTDHPGSSQYFLGSVICYSNDSKIRDLGVPKELIENQGAVSKECALAMAKGIRKRFGSDMGLAITGIAGPDGGTKKKPVGLVFIATDLMGELMTQKFHFRGKRHDIRGFGVYFALNHLRLF